MGSMTMLATLAVRRSPSSIRRSLPGSRRTRCRPARSERWFAATRRRARTPSSGRFPAKFTVPSHWHSNDVAVVMTQGAMVIEAEGAPARTIEQGGYFFLPGQMRYVAKCALPCTFLAWGEKPFDIHYSDPKDDPRLKNAGR